MSKPASTPAMTARRELEEELDLDAPPVLDRAEHGPETRFDPNLPRFISKLSALLC